MRSCFEGPATDRLTMSASEKSCQFLAAVRLNLRKPFRRNQVAGASLHEAAFLVRKIVDQDQQVPSFSMRYSAEVLTKKLNFIATDLVDQTE